jgi:hypothetical protein
MIIGLLGRRQVAAVGLCVLATACRAHVAQPSSTTSAASQPATTHLLVPTAPASSTTSIAVERPTTLRDPSTTLSATPSTSIVMLSEVREYRRRSDGSVELWFRASESRSLSYGCPTQPSLRIAMNDAGLSGLVFGVILVTPTGRTLACAESGIDECFLHEPAESTRDLPFVYPSGQPMHEVDDERPFHRCLNEAGV